MAASKNILRSLIVTVLVVAAGFFGLLLLGENTVDIAGNSSNGANDAIDVSGESDRFADIGGKTPQETLNLFINTLEINDIAAAVNYFVPENRTLESEDLARLGKVNLLGDLVADLKTVQNGKNIDNSHYSFEILDPTGQAAFELLLVKNAGGIWKIVSL